MSNSYEPPKQAQLEERLYKLESIVQQIAEASTLSNTLGHGFDVVSGRVSRVADQLDLISTQLRPLRRLEGAPVPLGPEQQRILDNLQNLLKRPEQLARLRSLPVDDKPVPFIGDIPDAQTGSTASTAAAKLAARSTPI